MKIPHNPDWNDMPADPFANDFGSIEYQTSELWQAQRAFQQITASRGILDSVKQALKPSQVDKVVAFPSRPQYVPYVYPQGTSGDYIFGVQVEPEVPTLLVGITPGQERKQYAQYVRVPVGSYRAGVLGSVATGSELPDFSSTEIEVVHTQVHDLNSRRSTDLKALSRSCTEIQFPRPFPVLPDPNAVYRRPDEG